MTFLSRGRTAPIAYPVGFIRAIFALAWRYLQDWRARDRDRFYLGSLSLDELERQAKDIGLSGTELLAEQSRPTRRSFGALEIAQRCRSETARRARLDRPADA